MSDATRARRWRLRAEELRTIADGMRTESARTVLFTLADQFDEMAERLERVARNSRGGERAAR